MALTWGFTVILIVYFSLIIFRTIQPLARLKKAGDRVQEISGIVAGHEGEESIASNGEKILTAFPIYSCEIDGNEKRQIGYMRFAVKQREKGSSVTIIYEPESGTIWCKEDIPLMKKSAVQRIIFIIILVAVVTIVGFLA